ncbi:hypothetical protein [Actinomadura parmotrematis]|uniref:DUF4244 domain-containing protein n=1 Tax=Actinomadura parmotrematis TaxID=2864039 RepID=A0ABS7FX08_9ACTN|nr:hypothetical protein [Actinomadura parmotrematis]MBW8484705.1 hypothetical protein [Actinomadura parmotrematis]
MNPLNDPAVVYLRALLAVRLDRARREDLSRGASALEWAIITAVLAVITVTIAAIIKKLIIDKANTINTDTE